jgi:tetratricopeptide (TPR) repeat protein
MDYYAQALVFDPASARARERSLLTLGQITELERRATEGDFTAAELQGTRWLKALANADETRRRAELEALMQEEASPELPLMAGSSLERLAGDLGVPRRSRPKTRPNTDAEPSVIASAEIAAADAGTGSEPSAESGAPAAPVRDPARARELTREGIEARRGGRRAEAARLFHRALELDPRHAPAHYELAELAFDDADYANATKLGERAVALAPRNAGYRVFLGDLYLRMIEYAKAREEYERALELGHERAQARLDRLREKTGR